MVRTQIDSSRPFHYHPLDLFAPFIQAKIDHWIAQAWEAKAKLTTLRQDRETVGRSHRDKDDDDDGILEKCHAAAFESLARVFGVDHPLTRMHELRLTGVK
jgi:hypothetical protein